MNAPTDGIEPPYTTTTTSSGKPHGGDACIFVIGFFCTVVILISLTYTSYICKRPQPPPPPSITVNTATYDDADSHRVIRFSGGLDHDVIVTLPTFVYDDDAATDSSCCCCCSICLLDYEPGDVVRLLPECGHLFHVSCVDTWLEAHPTCPMCRNKPVPVPVPVPDGDTGSPELID